MNTYLSLSNQGHGATASNTTAATSLAISIGNSSDPSGTYIASQLFVLCVAIYANGVLVSSISGGGNSNTGWTYQGHQIDPVTNIRVECWTNQILTGVSFSNTTINFSSSTLASACVTSYIEPYDFPTIPLVNAQAFSTYASGPRTETYTYNQPITAGNLLVVGLITTGTLTAYSNAPSDTLGTTYTRGGFSKNTWTTVDTYVGLAGASSSSTPFTIVWTGGNTGSSSVFISQYSGMTATVDTSAASSPGAGTWTLNLTTTAANDLLYGLGASFDGVTGFYFYQNPLFYYQNPAFFPVVPNTAYPSYNGGDSVGCGLSAGSYTFQGQGYNVYSVSVTAIKANTFTGAAAPNPQTSSTYGAGYFASGTITPQSSNNIIVTCVAFASSNGDSFNSAGSAVRASVVSTVTSAAAAIIDSYAEDTFAANNQVRFNASRNWVTFSFELNSGNTTRSLASDAALISTAALTAPAYADQHQLKSGDVSTAFSGYQLKSGEVYVPYEPPHFEQSSGGASIYISGTQMANGTVGFAYSETMTANGGFPPYTWSLLSGTLPPGLSIGPTTGIISGTPTSAGTYTFTVEATDSLSNTATNTFSITIGIVLSGGGSTVFLY